MTGEQQDRYERNIEKARPYENLWLNDDFQRFKQEQFDDVLAKCIASVMWETDITDSSSIETAKKNILKFQTLQFAFHDVFNQKIDAKQRAKEELKKIQKQPSI